MKCPKCGSKRVARILYGMPAFNEEMQRKINNEELYLGGCCISEHDPGYHCFGCGKDIGSAPVLYSKRGKEDYRDIVRSIRFKEGSHRGGYQEILIKKPRNQIIINVTLGIHQQLGYLRREMTEEEWKKLLNRLYTKLYLHEWKKSFVNANVLDGKYWELEIKLTDGRVRNYRGSNAFPPHWSELKNTFQPFFKEAEIQL